MRELDEYGNWLWMGEHQYVEMIFAVDIDNLHEYHLEGILMWQDFVTLNGSVSFELRDEVGIPRQPSPEEKVQLAEWETMLEELFGDLPRYVFFSTTMGILWALYLQQYPPSSHLFMECKVLQYGGQRLITESLFYASGTTTTFFPLNCVMKSCTMPISGLRLTNSYLIKNSNSAILTCGNIYRRGRACQARSIAYQTWLARQASPLHGKSLRLLV